GLGSLGVHPEDVLHYLLGVCERRTRRPSAEHLIPIPNDTDVLGLVLIDFGIEVCETKLAPEFLYVARGAGKQGPTWLDVMHRGVFLQLARPVMFRIESDRVHEHILPNPIPEQFLYLLEVLGHQRTQTLTFGIEHVNHDDFSLDEIVVESDRLVILGPQ